MKPDYRFWEVKGVNPITMFKIIENKKWRNHSQEETDYYRQAIDQRLYSHNRLRVNKIMLNQ